MSTYLQGVQDYIPQFQPFQPDLNLYANVLQTKQTQYDSAWKSLNNVYGQYFYADLTRDNNIERKEEILKNIDFNIKKVSGLDLSLDENVDKASKIFKPFYEDEYLMKDMAWTKNYSNQKGRAEGYKNSIDEKIREQYWDGGVRALDYMREEFKEVADQESLNFQNSSYTPYVNSVKKAQQIAKDAGLSVENIEFSEDGRWIVKKKNGEALIEPLSKLFEATLGNDPAIQAVYKTQAYIDRKDYAYSNAGQFGGDKNAAEMKYLEESYTQLKQENERQYKNLQNTSTVYQSNIKQIEELIKNKKAGPGAEQRLEQLKEAKGINDNILERIDKNNEAMKTEIGTPTTSSGFQNPYGDVKSLRWKVDNARASSLMQKDLNEAAYIFSFKDAKTDMEANPYAVNEQKHAFSMQEVAARNQGLANAARIRNQGEALNKMNEKLVESGVADWDTNQYVIDPATGETVANPNYGSIVIKDEAQYQFSEKNVDGSVTDAIKKIDVARKNVNNATNESAIPYLSNMVESIDFLRGNNKISDEDIKYIFEKYPGMDTKKMKNMINSGKLSTFLLHSNDPWKAKDLAYRFQNVLQDNKDLPEVQSEMQKMQPFKNKYMDYTNYLTNQQKFFKTSTKEVETELARQGYTSAHFLYDDTGKLRSKNEYYSLLKEKKGLGYSETNEQIRNIDKRMAELEKQRPSTNWLLGIATDAAELVTGTSKKGKGTWDGEEYYKLKKQRERLGRASIYEDKDIPESVNYDNMVSAASSIWSSDKVKTNLLGVKGEGSGLYQDQKNSVMVYPTGPANLPGMRNMMQFKKDFSSIDFDDANNVISITGASKSAFDQNIRNDINTEYIGERTKAKKALLNAAFADMANSQNKLKPFKLSSLSVAAGNANKGAMIMYPDIEWLKTYMGKADKDGKYAGLFSENDFNNILKNGITVIADSKYLTNDLYKSGTMTQFEANVNYSKSGYTEKSPYDPETSFTIKKNEYGTGEYTLGTQFREWDPNINNWGETKTEYISTTGPSFDLDSYRAQMQDEFIRLSMKNTALKNL